MEWGGLRLTLNMLRVAGLTPLRRHSGSAVWTCVYYAHLMYRVVIIMIVNIFSISSFVVDVIRDIRNTEHYVVGTDTRIQFFLWLLQLAILIFITDIGAWYGSDRLTRIHEFLGWMKKSNLKVYGNKKWRELKRILLGIITLGMVICINLSDTVRIITTISRGDIDVIVLYLYGSIQMESIVAVVLLLEFSFTMYTYHAAMESLNGKLYSILNMSKGRTLTSAEEDSLRSMGTAYIFIGETVDQFNTIDGSVLLLILIFFYEAIILNLYRTIDSVLNFAKDGAPFQKRPVFWLMAIVLLVIGLVEPSHQFQKEVDRMRVLMAKLINQCTGPGEAAPPALGTCCSELMAISTTFRPLGLFNLTRSLLTTVLSASITCLVFIAQSQIS